MNIIDTWGVQVRQITQEVWDRIIVFAPNIIGAVVIALIGAIAGVVVGYVVTRILQAVKIQSLADQSRFTDVLKKAKLQTDIAEISGTFVKWVIFLTFLLSAATVLEVKTLKSFIENVFSYLPVVIGVVIFIVIAAQIVEALAKLTRAAVDSTGVKLGRLAMMVVRWALYIFIGITSLFALGVPREFIVIMFIGLTATLAIAAGIAFGLGGKDHANDLVKKIRDELK